MYSAPMTTSFADYHPRYEKKDKLVSVFKCKKHGRIDVKHDKLINIGGTKFCPFCAKDVFEQFGVCQLKRSKEPSRNGKRGR